MSTSETRERPTVSGPVDRPLRIRIVSRYDAFGGAEVVAHDQWTGYRRRGHDAVLIVGQKQLSDPDIVEVPGSPPGSRVGWWRQVLDGADVVHFHNLHGKYVPWSIVRSSATRGVVAATLHDQYLFTGGCVHTFGCDRWTRGCGSCPQRVDSESPPDDTAVQWRLKSRLWSTREIHAVAPASWIYDRACRSIMSGHETQVHRIPHGVDTGVFRPRDRARLRVRYSIDPQGVVLLAAGHRIRTNRTKDWSTLEASLAILRSRVRAPVVLLVAGEYGDDVSAEGVTVRFLGNIESRNTMADYYALADVFVHSSRAETFSMAILEAMASGCAVVTTSVGGVDEQLDPDSLDQPRGLVVACGQPERLASALIRLIEDGSLRNGISASAAAHVRREWTLDKHIDAHLDLYRSRLKQPPSSS